MRDEPAVSAAGTPWESVDFRWLLAGRGIDSLGNAMYPIGLGFGMLRLFDSLTALGLVVGAGSLGLVTFLLAGGVLADRLSRRTVLVASNLVAAVCQLGIVAMVVADVANLPALVALSFATGAAAAFDGPASTALTPQTLRPETLYRGNAQLSLVRRSGNIGGAATAGFLTALFGPATALAVNAVTFAAAGFCFGRIDVAPAPPREPSPPLADLREGWDEFRSRTWVWVVVLAFFFINGVWVGGFHLLGVVIAEDTMGPGGWGLVLAAEGVGGIVGTVASNRWEPRRPMRTGMLAAATTGIPLIALATWPSLAPMLVASFLGGIGIMVFAVAWETSLQRHIPADRLARVASWDGLGSFAAIPLGSFLAGPLAEAFGTRTVVRGAAATTLIAALAALASRGVRNLE